MEREFFILAFRNVRRRLMARHSDDDEDALQDAFCRLWTRRDDFSSQGEAEGFLTVAARNITVDTHRHRQAHPETDIENANKYTSDDDEASSKKEQILEIKSLIRTYLSPRDREILVHRDHDGWEFDEIASHYQISEANARMIVSRSRKTIREIYLKRQKL
ncbi:MAG: sigma-70 family RNA polymerase sigma factor [Muribaculaceae bacterium]|nr:sigma-70 family RNA polymerase sigma factor [Muribaculaceae bacterium]